MSPTLLTKDEVSEFKTNGLLILRGFYPADDLLSLQYGIHQIIGQVMEKNNFSDTRSPFKAEHFDEGYLALIKHNRSWGGEVYDAVKQLPALLRLASNPRHEIIVKQLRDGAVPGIAAGGYGIRIDNPFEDKFRALWHQEYPAQLRSLDGIVFWSPLVSITEEIGPVQFCPGSHLEGPLPVLTSDPNHSERSGAYALRLNDEAVILDRYSKCSPLTNPGDLVIIDFLLLHASGHNKSVRSRWSMQFRYFNFAEPTGRAHGWKGSFAAGVDFRTIHPELCIK